MKYRIKDEIKDREETLDLYLERELDVIYLKGTDPEGFDWKLLKIKDGKISTVAGVGESDTGFETDKNGELEIYREEN